MVSENKTVLMARSKKYLSLFGNTLKYCFKVFDVNITVTIIIWYLYITTLYMNHRIILLYVNALVLKLTVKISFGQVCCNICITTHSSIYIIAVLFFTFCNVLYYIFLITLKYFLLTLKYFCVVLFSRKQIFTSLLPQQCNKSTKVQKLNGFYGFH